MSKLNELLKERDLTEYELAISNGVKGREISIRRITNGEAEITSLNLNQLFSVARGLGVSLSELLDSFELDGRTSQIFDIKHLVKRIRDSHGEYSTVFNKEGFIKGHNVEKQKERNEFNYSTVKTDYEFLDSSKTDNQQDGRNIAELNKEFLYSPAEKSNQSLLSITPRYNKNALTFFIYTPLPGGGDLKTAVTVFQNDGSVRFSEIYGAEWIDEEDYKGITYYKSHFNDIITPETVKDAKKEIISELEYFKGMQSQFRKFKLAK